MRNKLQKIEIMKIKCFLLLILATFSLEAQNEEDWTWYNPPILGTYANEIQQDNEGNLWMMSGTKVVKYDGINWVAYDVLDTGLPLANAYPRSIDFSLGNVLWIATRDRVLEYNQETTQWTIHDPSNGSVNFNGNTIKVESEDKVYWTSGNRLYEYNGIEWISHNFYNFEVEMNENSQREIEIDNNNHKWITTLSSICFDVACFTPAGLLQLTETDTILHDGETLGFPQAFYTYIELDSNNDPFLAITEDNTDANFYMRFINGQWTTPIEIPFNGFLRDFELGNEDQIYLLFEEFIAIGENDAWDVIPLDSEEIVGSYSMAVTPENDIYIVGRKENIDSDNEGIMGYIPNLIYRARGLLYSDRNYNGIYDDADQTIQDHFVQTTNEDRITFSNNDGAYSMLFTAPATYQLEGLLPAYHSYGVPIDGIQTVELTQDDPVSIDHHFGFEPDTTAIDLSIAVTNVNGANPGFQTCYKISLKNYAPRITGGTVSILFDEILIFETADQAPSSMNGNELTFEIDPLDWLEMKNITVCFSLPPDPYLIGTALKNTSTITPDFGTDLMLENNVDTLCQTITGPYDPNFIAVRPAGVGESGDIPLTTSQLEYTIHFQNIGSDTARNVVISNPIDNDLDIVSVAVIGSSHDYDLNFIEEGRVFQWIFNNINLPDSTANEVESHGFVKYIIDIANQDVNTVFTNQADIFFDFNLPIITNTTVNTLVEETTVSIDGQSYSKQCDFTLQVYDENLLLQFPAVNKYTVTIFDLSGRLLHSSLAHHSELNITKGDWPDGLYMVSVKSRDCQSVQKVFIR